MKQIFAIIILVLLLGGCNKDESGATSPETITYTITPLAGNNGIITPSTPVKVKSGENQRFVFTPNVGYLVDSVLVNGLKVDSSLGYTFLNVKANYTIRVTFKLVPFIIITPISGHNGTINPSAPTYIAMGQSQRFTFTPNNNYQVDSVFVNGVEVDSLISYTFLNVTANHSIRVVYSPVVAEKWTYPSDGVKFAATVYSNVSTVQNGSRFEVLVVYYNMTNVFGTAIELKIPTDKVSIRNVVAGPYISGNSALILKKLESTTGRVSYGATFTANSGNTANGSGVIFKLKCRAKNAGNISFTINSSKLQILQTDGMPIPNFNSIQIENLNMGIQ